jgi:toxin FitB
LVARREADGRPFNAMDALIAATAHVHELTLVTRNVSDFKASLKSLLNPWT